MLLLLLPGSEHQRRAFFIVGKWKIPAWQLTYVFAPDNRFEIYDERDVLIYTGDYRLDESAVLTLQCIEIYDDGVQRQEFGKRGLGYTEGLSAWQLSIPIFGGRIACQPVMRFGQSLTEEEKRDWFWMEPI